MSGLQFILTCSYNRFESEMCYYMWSPTVDLNPIKDWLPQPFRSTKEARPSKFLLGMIAKAGF